MQIHQIQKLISDACLAFQENGKSGALNFAVEAILRRNDLVPTELGPHRVWLLSTLERANDLKISAEKIEKLLKLLIPGGSKTWQDRFIEAAPPEKIPAYIKVVHDFERSQYLYGAFREHPLLSLRCAKKADATELFSKLIEEHLCSRLTFQCEFICGAYKTELLITNSPKGEMVREFTRGLFFPGSHYFLRYLPKSLRMRLDTLYLYDDDPSKLSDIKGILPIQRLVTKGGFSNVLQELPEVRELIVRGKWPENELPKERLQSIALELDEVTVTDQPTKNFLETLFGEIDWSSPVSVRYEPNGWQPVIQPPLSADLPLVYPKGNLVLALAPQLIKIPEEKMHLLEIAGILKERPDTYMMRDFVLGPKLIEWTEELWKTGELEDKICEQVLKRWNCFKMHTIFTKEGRCCELPEFPLRFALGLKEGELPKRVEHATVGGLHLLKKFFLNSWERFLPFYWIEGAKAATELGIKSFWSWDNLPESEPAKWSKKQIDELKANSPERWFKSIIYKMAGSRTSYFLTVRSVIKTKPTAWWEEIISSFVGIQIEGDPLSNCQAIMQNPDSFKEIKQLKWLNPKLDQQWAIAALCQDYLPNLEAIWIDYGCTYQKEAVPFSDFSFIKELPEKIEVCIVNTLLDAAELQKVNEYGKRNRKEAPIWLQKVKFQKCEDPNLDETPFKIYDPSSK